MDFLLKKTLISWIIMPNSEFSTIIEKIKVFFNKKSIEIYQLPRTVEEIEKFFDDVKSPRDPLLRQIALIMQSISLYHSGMGTLKVP